MTHDKPCVTRNAKENACGHMACVHMHFDGELYKRGGKSVRRGGEQQKGKQRKKNKKKEKKGREKEREKKISVSTVD